MRRPPGPGLRSTLSLARRFRRGSVEDFARLGQTYGDITYLPRPIDAYVVRSPALIERVLVSRQRAYRKSNNYRQLRRVMGDGLVTSDGHAWAEQRRQVGPAFRSAAVKRHLTFVHKASESLADRWTEKHGYFDASLDLAELSAQLTHRVLFGARSVATNLRPSIEQASKAVVERIYSPIRLPLTWPTPRNMRERRAVAAIDASLGAILKQPMDTDSLLFALKSHADVSDTALRDQMVTLMLAGQDTLAASLAWFFYCMAAHPEEQRRVRAELQTADDSGELPQTRAAFLEAMRLHPPIPVVARTPKSGGELLGDYSLPPESVVLCALSAMHRHPAHWDDADVYRPARFLSAQTEAREQTDAAPTAYAPFSWGPRKCIGERLAMAQALGVIRTVLRRFAVESKPAFVPVPHTTITMNSRNGIWIRLRQERA